MNSAIPKSPEDGNRRVFVALATSEYDLPQCNSLKCDDEVEVFRNWLCSPTRTSPFADAFPELSNNPSLEEIRTVFTEKLHVLRQDDALFVYITGHAEYIEGDDGGTHYLVLEKSEDGKFASTALPTRDVIAWILELDIDDVVVLVDVCRAGKAAAAVQNLRKYPPTWLVLGASANTPAGLGVLANSVKTYLDERKASDGPLLNRKDFMSDVGTLLRAEGQGLTFLQHELCEFGPSICLPNPARAAARGLTIALSSRAGDKKSWASGSNGPELYAVEKVLGADDRASSALIITADGRFAAETDGRQLLIVEADVESLAIVNRFPPIDLSGFEPGRLVALEQSGSGGSFLGLWIYDSGASLLYLPAGGQPSRLRQLSKRQVVAGALRPTMALLVSPHEASTTISSYAPSPNATQVLLMTAVKGANSSYVIMSGKDRDGEHVAYMQLEGETRWIEISDVCVISSNKHSSELEFLDADLQAIRKASLIQSVNEQRDHHLEWIHFGYEHFTRNTRFTPVSTESRTH